MRQCLLSFHGVYCCSVITAFKLGEVGMLNVLPISQFARPFVSTKLNREVRGFLCVLMYVDRDLLKAALYFEVSAGFIADRGKYSQDA